MENSTPLPLAVVEFTANNPHAKAAKEDDRLIISSPWGYEDSQFVFNLSETEIIEQLRYLLIVPQLDAFNHLDSNEAEFIFAFLHPTDPKVSGYLDRNFCFHFQGTSYACSFREPSERLFALAANYRPLPSDGAYQSAPQLIAFRDFQRRTELGPVAGRYFKDRVPRSFFIKPSIPLKEVDWESLTRHLNLLMVYYDRSSPRIVYRQKSEAAKEQSVEALRFIESTFPKELVFRPTDDVLLRLIDIARTSEARFAYIYSFQIFEYAGFYFIDAKTKTALSKLLRSPSFISCAEDRMAELFSLLTDSAQNDDFRIRKVIEEHCDPKLLWREIEKNKEFFYNDVCFDGGFNLPKLIAKDTTEETWCTMWTPRLIEQITRVRNCLVHAREKRENKAILPTDLNDKKLSLLLPIVLRMAEQIVIHNERG